MNRIHFECTASTNAIARDLVDQGSTVPALITAERQEAGKGQYNRTFSSPAGGLYFTLLYQPKLASNLLPMLTLATGVACADCIAERFSLVPALKWPNDIFIGDRKLGGILCESIILPGSEAWVIIGVGINVNSTVSLFPEELEPTITTIRDQTGEYSPIEPFLDDIVSAIFDRTSLLSKNYTLVLETWRRYDYLLCRPVRYQDNKGELTGIGQGLEQNGCYRIKDHNGRLHSVLGGTLRPA